MKYEHIIAGTPRRTGASRAPDRELFRRERPGIKTATRRFPPVVQVLTRTEPHVEQQLAAIAMQSHQQGKPLAEVCRDLYYYARSLGYHATIGVQEVYSSNMPSFPGQTVLTALLMVDLAHLSTRSADAPVMNRAV